MHKVTNLVRIISRCILRYLKDNDDAFLCFVKMTK